MKKFRNLKLKESQKLNANELDSIVAGSSVTIWPCLCSHVGDTCESATANWHNEDEDRFQQIMKGSCTIASGLIAAGSGKTIGMVLGAVQTVDGFMEICSAIGISGYTTRHQCITYPIQNVHNSHRVISD